MLRSLERGIKGGKWFALIDKVYEPKNLQSSFWKVWRNAGSAGIDGQSVKSFEAREEQQLLELAEELCTERYRPAAVKRVWIPKPGSQEKRPLGGLIDIKQVFHLSCSNREELIRRLRKRAIKDNRAGVGRY